MFGGLPEETGPLWTADATCSLKEVMGTRGVQKRVQVVTGVYIRRASTSQLQLRNIAMTRANASHSRGGRMSQFSRIELDWQR
jgi:hypothetical protein